MINIKCKKCGWCLPFKSKKNEDAIRNRELGNIICPNCGRMLIRQVRKKHKHKT